LPASRLGACPRRTPNHVLPPEAGSPARTPYRPSHARAYATGSKAGDVPSFEEW
jgi:hypothetical protein